MMFMFNSQRLSVLLFCTRLAARIRTESHTPFPRRTLVNDARLDPILEGAALNAGITDIAHRLPRAVMWINPGEVKFTQYAVGELSEQKSIVYSAGKASSSPKEWDPSYYENHKPFVVDQSEVGGGWTPPAGSGPSKEAVARFEIARAVRNSAKPGTASPTTAIPNASGVYQIGRVGNGNPRAVHIGTNGVSNGHAHFNTHNMYP